MIAEEFGEDLVLLNLRSGSYYDLRGAAKALFQSLTAGADLDTLGTALGKYGADKPAMVTQTVQRFIDYKLLRSVVENRADFSATRIDQVALTIASASESLHFEKFDDLADLVAADPIHDVQTDAAWPIMA